MSLLAFLVLSQVDARLDAPATLLEPRVTYAELGAWVQKATGVRVSVAAAIRERKATVLVEDRPVRETMARVAEALFLEWERTETGYVLRLQPKVAQEEVWQVALEERLASEGLLAELDALAKASGLDDEALAEGIEAGVKALKAAKDGEAKTAARARLAPLLMVRGDPLRRAVGRTLAGMGAAERRELLLGRRLYASRPERPGMRRLPNDPNDDRPTMLTMRIKPGTRSLSVEANWPGTGAGMGFSVGAENSPAFEAAVEAGPLSKRMEEWAKSDAAGLGIRLGPLRRPVREHESGYRTLGDLLVSLHERTGAPVVADGFRESVTRSELPDGGDVGAWLGALKGFVFAPRQRARVREGWVMMRRARYWQQLPREVPERAIRALETSKGLTLEEVAAFAGSLSELQAEHVDPDRLVMDAPNEALSSNVPFLRLWNAMPFPSRQAALAEHGLSANALPAVAQPYYGACLRQSFENIWMPESLAYALPNGPALPEDLRLVVRRGQDTPVAEVMDVPVGSTEPPVPRFRLYTGVVAELGSLEKPLARYCVPLRPKRPIGGR